MMMKLMRRSDPGIPYLVCTVVSEYYKIRDELSYLKTELRKWNYLQQLQPLKHKRVVTVS